ncbi:MAG: hypothetical protein JNJ45_05835 [Chthonomonas sp.]|nr:hypothetical protein [Chthonomonas sp.]
MEFDWGLTLFEVATAIPLVFFFLRKKVRPWAFIPLWLLLEEILTIAFVVTKDSLPPPDDMTYPLVAMARVILSYLLMIPLTLKLHSLARFRKPLIAITVVFSAISLVLVTFGQEPLLIRLPLIYAVGVLLAVTAGWLFLRLATEE